MSRLTSERGATGRAIVLTLFVLIVLAYGALTVLFPGPPPADSTIVPFARVHEVAATDHSTRADSTTARSAGGPRDRR